MMKIGITGQAGFVGTHLFNLLGTKKEVERIPFEDAFFESSDRLAEFVKQCDVVVHLAAMNRHEDEQVLYNTNINLVQQLITAMEREHVYPHVFFSSSTQENRDNLYGKSKREGRQLLCDWAKKNNAYFTGLVIPNIFGPFGQPYYNSVVATFCHQLTHEEQPKIQTDGLLQLIYVTELCEEIYQLANNKASNEAYVVPHTAERKVSEILTLLEIYKDQYFKKGIFPALNDHFETNLFNTFRSFIQPDKHFPARLTRNTDDRGSFVETIKLHTGGQVSFSTTKAGITRGNHYHARKIERFVVLSGKALIQLRKIGTPDILNFELSGESPAYVDMPIWYTHNIKNIGPDELLTLFWINEIFDPNDPDTFFEVV